MCAPVIIPADHDEAVEIVLLDELRHRLRVCKASELRRTHVVCVCVRELVCVCVSWQHTGDVEYLPVGAEEGAACDGPAVRGHPIELGYLALQHAVETVGDREDSVAAVQGHARCKRRGSETLFGGLSVCVYA